jgi:hypothetical protein
VAEELELLARALQESSMPISCQGAR